MISMVDVNVLRSSLTCKTAGPCCSLWNFPKMCEMQREFIEFEALLKAFFFYEPMWFIISQDSVQYILMAWKVLRKAFLERGGTCSVFLVSVAFGVEMEGSLSWACPESRAAAAASVSWGMCCRIPQLLSWGHPLIVCNSSPGSGLVHCLHCEHTVEDRVTAPAPSTLFFCVDWW